MNWIIGPGLITIGCLLMGYQLGRESVEECAKPAAASEWRQSPHETQEEPRLASTPKIPEDERFIF